MNWQNGASRHLRITAIAAIAVIASGCYHATINTGRTPSGQQVERPWAHSFIYGLVSPSTVETAAQCPNGVARVETQHSFLNMLVGAITFGIYTPMDIRVQCAASGGGDDAEAPALSLPESASMEQLHEALASAAETSARTGTPVFVHFSNLD